MERFDRMWSTGEGNGKPLQHSCLKERGKGMRSDASLGGGAIASPQAAVTQQVISRCVRLACGAFSKKSCKDKASEWSLAGRKKRGIG